jgi:hypothetical protein
MSTTNTQSLNCNSYKQGKDNKIKTDFSYYETVVKNDNSETQRILLICHKVWIKSEDGTIRETYQGDRYKVEIKNGKISFDKPLKFENNER